MNTAWTGSYIVEATDINGEILSSKIIGCYRHELKDKLQELKAQIGAETVCGYHSSGGFAVEYL